MRLRGFLTCSMPSMPASFWNSSLAPSATCALPTCCKSSCTRPAWESGIFPPFALARDFGLAGEHFADLLRVELGERAVFEAHVLATFGETTRELVGRHRDATGAERDLETEPIHPGRDAGAGAEVFGADLHVDQVVGDEIFPGFGERAEAFGPEGDRVVAAADEPFSRLRRARSRARARAPPPAVVRGRWRARSALSSPARPAGAPRSAVTCRRRGPRARSRHRRPRFAPALR